jgi:hypothetical protein
VIGLASVQPHNCMSSENCREERKLDEPLLLANQLKDLSDLNIITITLQSVLKAVK